MPYIVPSTATSTSCSTVTPPHSPSRPPLIFSLALASPAPVPVSTPFAPPELPTSPRVASSAVAKSQSFGLAAREATHRHSSKQPPPLVKALSEINTPTAANSQSFSTDEYSPPTSREPTMRRAASTSNASPTRSLQQHSNFAGNSLPHIPRRRTGTSISMKEVDNKIASQQSTVPARGRLRSRFVVGSGEESGSGSGEELRGEIDRRGKPGADDAKGQPHHKQSAVRGCLSLNSYPAGNRSSISNGSASDSEASDCATPTQKTATANNRLREPVPRSDDSQGFKCSTSTEPNILGMAPRARRGRGREGARKLIFGSDSEDEVGTSKLGQSTVEFPTSGPLSPSPSIAVNTPTPELTPFSSPLQDLNLKGFSGKRANAGSLRLDFSFGSRPSETNGEASGRGHSIEHGRALSESASLNNVPLIRKKSGEIVRPSLKMRSSSVNSARHRPSLSLGDISSLATGSPSISAPTTPVSSAKTVHFDAQLEHVRLFKSSSRPTAVSRDGSPTYDDTTSGGEGDSASEGPASIGYITRPRPRRLVPGGSMGEEEEAVRRVLMMRVLNMPHRDLDIDDADVRLECLHLADDAASVQGIVRVRNIAFEKTVAVRFTFDGWQTTSEVLGVWSESCVPRKQAPSSIPRPRAVSAPLSGVKTDETFIATFDRFTFSIRLADLLLRIDEKTLVLAVRYNTNGREMWDNNDGQNYRAVFERRPQHSLTLADSAVVPPSSGQAKEKGKTEEAGGRPVGLNGSSSSGSTSCVGRTGSSPNVFNTLDKIIAGTTKFKDSKPLSPIKRTSDLSSRYDIDSSLKNPSSWKPSLEKIHSWAGHGLRQSQTITHSPIPWAVEKPSREGTGKFVADFFKSRPFESYSLNFNSRGAARGSPRDLDRDILDDSEVERFSRARFAVVEDAAISDGNPLPRFHPGAARFVSPPSSWVSTVPESHTRNHHRSYFDAWASSGGATSTFGTGKARLTPPGSPGSFACLQLSDSDVDDLSLPNPSRPEKLWNSSPGRCNSFPPLIPIGHGSAGAGLGLTTVRPLKPRCDQIPSDSEASTPSITSVSSPTTTASPSSPPELLSVMPSLDADWSAPPGSAPLDKGDYTTFVNSFCFYQGQLDTPGLDMRRTHSESEVQDLLSTPPPSSGEAFPLLKGSASVSAGFDSRAATPTPGRASPSPGVVSPTPTSAGILETESGLSTRVRC